MKELSNRTVDEMARYLPMILTALDDSKIRADTRLGNAVRIIRHQIIPKLYKINKRSNE